MRTVIIGAGVLGASTAFHLSRNGHKLVVIDGALEGRATAVGVMNSIGWLGGGVAPVAMAKASGVWGMGTCLSATSAVYAVAGVLLVMGASRWMRKAVSPAALPPAAAAVN